jgi:hypothetical protein
MSYHRKHPGLGDAAETIRNVATGVSTALDITRDPYLPETICRTQQLIAIEGKHPVPVCAKTRPNLQGGIGLRKAVPLLRAYVYAQQHAWVYPVVGAVAIGVPVVIGYLLGKGLRR